MGVLSFDGLRNRIPPIDIVDISSRVRGMFTNQGHVTCDDIRDKKAQLTQGLRATALRI